MSGDERGQAGEARETCTTCRSVEALAEHVHVVTSDVPDDEPACAHPSRYIERRGVAVSAPQPIPDDELAAIKARAEAATPGPMCALDSRSTRPSRRVAEVDGLTSARGDPHDRDWTPTRLELMRAWTRLTTLRLVAEVRTAAGARGDPHDRTRRHRGRADRVDDACSARSIRHAVRQQALPQHRCADRAEHAAWHWRIRDDRHRRVGRP